jgi:hypothetical protein
MSNNIWFYLGYGKEMFLECDSNPGDNPKHFFFFPNTKIFCFFENKLSHFIENTQQQKSEIKEKQSLVGLIPELQNYYKIHSYQISFASRP